MTTTTDSRAGILAKIKKSKPRPTSLPEIPLFEIPGDPLANFIGHLKGFDGDSRLFATREDATRWINSHIDNPQKQIIAFAEGVNGNVSLDQFASAADMHTIDICIAESMLGVGETGSLLVDTRSLDNPAAALFSTELYLLIDRRHIVGSIQEAYQRLDLSDYRYSSFFSGPSATADIEAVHITGAQGEISLTALIYGCTPEEIDSDAAIPASTPMAPAITLLRESNPSNGQDSI